MIGAARLDVSKGIAHARMKHAPLRPGRYGHGMGLFSTEPPHISEADHTIIEAGMVLTMEPGMWTAEGMFHCEHNVLVMPGGNEILSDSPLELTEAG